MFYNQMLLNGVDCFVSGDDILLPNGEINRPALGQLVFNDVEKRRLLNYITHPLIHRSIYMQIGKYLLLGHNFVVLDLPLLFETGRFLPYIHKIITVTWYVRVCLHSNWSLDLDRIYKDAHAIHFAYLFTRAARKIFNYRG